ncbi:MAG: hypothetical protein RIC29_15245 [Rhodospirillaceae bacterium]
MPAEASSTSGTSKAGFFTRPPFIGLFAFFIVFVFQGLGHTIMIVMENVFGEEYVYQCAFAMGLAGAGLLFWGMKSSNEVAATWLGFWAGSFLWTGWVEFSFVWSGNYLGVPDLMDPNMPGEIATKAEYLVMMSSVGVLASTLVYFLLNKDTKCNFFLWFQRNAGMRVAKPTPNYERNFAAITALETIYVIWFFYLMLLFIYDENILGDRHPVTYGIFFLNTIWGFYLFQRLIKFWRVPTAIRYGIPTAIICWNSVELAGRWHLFTEFWEKPTEFALEMTLVLVAIAIAAVLAARAPANPKSALSAEERAAHRS